MTTRRETDTEVFRILISRYRATSATEPVSRALDALRKRRTYPDTPMIHSFCVYAVTVLTCSGERESMGHRDRQVS
jgi:hypothetical protein